MTSNFNEVRDALDIVTYHLATEMNICYGLQIIYGELIITVLEGKMTREEMLDLWHKLNTDRDFYNAYMMERYPERV